MTTSTTSTATQSTGGDSEAEVLEPGTRRLAELLGDDGSYFPATVKVAGADAVVLGRNGAGTIEVFRGGLLVCFADNTPAVEVTELAQRAMVISRALIGIDQLRREAKDELNRQHEHHQAELADIRDYAVERHRDGDICESGLTRFLEAFDLPPYLPRLRVSFLIRGSYEVETDEDYARSEAERYLRPDLADIDCVADSLVAIQVEIEDVEQVDV